jgi:mono/diheme cytochrome c family protein
MRPAPLSAFALCALLAWPAAAWTADTQRGRVLYESACLGCHAESVHGRPKREAADFESVRRWVRRWSANLGLKWSEQEVTDVAVHLNARFYRFACPPADCNVTGSRDDGARRLALDARSR